MRRLLLLLAVSPLFLAVPTRTAAAQAVVVERSRGQDERGTHDIAWVRLRDGAGDPAARERVNAALKREALLHVCHPEPDAERRRHQEAWYEMEVTYRSPRLLGIRTSMEIYCGGVGLGTGALLYDLRTGKRIELEDEMADPPAFRRFVAIRALEAAPGDAGDCAELYTLDQLAKTRYVYVLGERSLTAVQDYPRVALACAHETELAYADVVRFARPGSPLRSLGER